MILDPLEEKIRDAILEFPWWDYGLDLVGRWAKVPESELAS